MADTPARNPEYPTFDECLKMGVHIAPMIGRMEADCGHSVLVAFLLRWGGVELNIPKSAPDEKSPFATVLNWLRRDIGYGAWRVPRALVNDRTVLRWRMLHLLRAGQSLSEVARAVGCTARTVSYRKTDFTRRGLLPSPDLVPTKENRQ
ncbi:helix-turn-helix domain-containing protein [Meridianimarinicoccus aquatilis]|uniref:Helix-turn-helix domain-containing protein n=1 Tax=Meridianimarinicoccus aquatilis TaxID=2552766 RepID=A0A4R6AI58_9RHOB|nr:helix-turn-helix domain-containing protein [Fluviibacterium aquatile]TDL83901.1 helix-turn-helix domain-containing protein [Fluviibacterium aquatile]